MTGNRLYRDCFFFLLFIFYKYLFQTAPDSSCSTSVSKVIYQVTEIASVQAWIYCWVNLVHFSLLPPDSLLETLAAKKGRYSHAFLSYLDYFFSLLLSDKYFKIEKTHTLCVCVFLLSHLFKIYYVCNK